MDEDASAKRPMAGGCSCLGAAESCGRHAGGGGSMRGKTEGASLVLIPAERWWVGGCAFAAFCLLFTD